MKNLLLLILILFFSTSLFAADEKLGRYFEDQPDVNDDFQIHFLYLVDSDSEDREWDVSGKMTDDIKAINELFYKMTGDKQKWKIDMRKEGVVW